jgi:hypothetical protein
MVGKFHQYGAMVATAFPFRIGSDLDTLHIRRPVPRDEAVVDMKWALLLPLKVISGLLLFAVPLAMKEMVAAY